ncbi:MAG TPA: oligosaccharide repeat unit polymerase [Campylobacterales bacterium]|nr:oligosaccharide repeat unit polymerase [Campylobacterales bacterium]
MFYILIFLYSIFLLWFGILFSQYKISLYTSAYIIYTLLIGIPFFIIFAEVQDIFYISKIIDRGLEAKVALHLNDGIRPITYLLIFNFIYLSIGTIGLFEFKKSKVLKPKMDIEYANRVYALIKVALIITFTYIFIRYIFYPDFPLFVLLKNGFSSDFILRDLAFSYGHNHNIPYIFLPSINSQFYRILLPVSFFTLLYYYQNYKTSYNTKLLLIFTLVMVIALNFGTFKRTPILYLSTWFIIYLYMYIDDLKALAKIFIFVTLTIIVLVLITALYSDKDAHTIILNILARFAVGEAIGEFLAIEHFGTTFEYMNFDILTLYIQKVMGMDVMTFSEIWKILTGGTRGYTSIGVIAEFIVSFGYISIIYFIFFTASIIQLDIFFKANSNSFNRPIIAGLITVISYMMIKGFFAQLFTGGVIVLIFVYFIMKIYTTDSVDSVKIESSIHI